MGKGMFLGALSGLGNAAADIGKENQRVEEAKAAALLRQADEERMLKLRADASVEMQTRIAEAQAAREQAGAAKAGRYLIEASAPQPVVAAPVTELTGIGAGEGYQGTDGKPIVGLTGNLEAKRAEIMSIPDDDDRAVALELFEKQIANTQVAADKAVEGKTVKPSMEDALQGAIERAISAGDTASAMALKKLVETKGDRYINAGDGEIFDKRDGKYLPRSADRTQREKEEAAAKEAMENKKLDAQVRLAEIRTASKVKEAATPEDIDKVARLIAANKMAPLSNYAMNSAQGKAVMARVLDINPNYDGKDFRVMQRAEGAFAVGPEGKAVKSFNVAIAHLGTLDSLVDALNNGDLKKVNELGNFYNAQTGKPAPIEFDAAKKIVADEITKAIIGGAGALADREETVKNIDRANSPAQLRGVIKTFQELMRGQLEGLKNQYETSTGNTDFDDRFLTAASRKVAYAGHSDSPAIPTAQAKPGAKPSLDDIFKIP